MKIKQVQRILMTNFLFVLLVGFLLVLLYETEILEPTNLAGDVTLVYVITVAMESYHCRDSFGAQALQFQGYSPSVGNP